MTRGAGLGEGGRTEEKWKLSEKVKRKERVGKRETEGGILSNGLQQHISIKVWQIL